MLRLWDCPKRERGEAGAAQDSVAVLPSSLGARAYAVFKPYPSCAGLSLSSKVPLLSASEETSTVTPAGLLEEHSLLSKQRLP